MVAKRLSNPDYEWKCENCRAVQPANTTGYAILMRHNKGHHVHLVEKATGKVVTTNVYNARKMGIDIPQTGGKKKKIAETNQEVEVEISREEPQSPDSAIGEVDEAGAVLETPEEPEAKNEEEDELPLPPTRDTEGEVIKAKEVTMELVGKNVLVPVSLPHLAFVLFDVAKSHGLVEDQEMELGQWLYECVQARFKLEYKFEFILNPVQ